MSDSTEACVFLKTENLKKEKQTQPALPILTKELSLNCLKSQIVLIFGVLWLLATSGI